MGLITVFTHSNLYWYSTPSYLVTGNSMNKTRICGSPDRPAIKILPIISPNVHTKDGRTYLQGYLSEKNRSDRYGDIPTVYKVKRDFVYDIKEYLKNSILLIDHINRVDHIAGSIVELKEDNKGLFFKVRFSEIDYPMVEHVKKIYAQGNARGISIAGRFHYENPNEPKQLTLLEVYEISLIGLLYKEKR